MKKPPLLVVFCFSINDGGDVHVAYIARVFSPTGKTNVA